MWGLWFWKLFLLKYIEIVLGVKVLWSRHSYLRSVDAQMFDLEPSMFYPLCHYGGGGGLFGSQSDLHIEGQRNCMLCLSLCRTFPPSNFKIVNGCFGLEQTYFWDGLTDRWRDYYMPPKFKQALSCTY